MERHNVTPVLTIQALCVVVKLTFAFEMHLKLFMQLFYEI